VRKHDVQFDREGLNYPIKRELFDVGVVYLLKDAMTQQVYYVSLNDDGDGAFISPSNIDK
jgi:hypothetical protein